MISPSSFLIRVPALVPAASLAADGGGAAAVAGAGDVRLSFTSAAFSLMRLKKVVNPSDTTGDCSQAFPSTPPPPPLSLPPLKSPPPPPPRPSSSPLRLVPSSSPCPSSVPTFLGGGSRKARRCRNCRFSFKVISRRLSSGVREKLSSGRCFGVVAVAAAPPPPSSSEPPTPATPPLLSLALPSLPLPLLLPLLPPLLKFACWLVLVLEEVGFKSCTAPIRACTLAFMATGSKRVEAASAWLPPALLKAALKSCPPAAPALTVGLSSCWHSTRRRSKSSFKSRTSSSRKTTRPLTLAFSANNP
mmetsp:Transcript_18771/g.38617  ORF Transcript_18771/g.38617 Transcript_18771/m.38617 type:complete len:303 (-) Transcript_18771:9-917(-)